jgi:hypothetical protein
MFKRAISYQLSAISVIFLLCSVCFGQVISSSELISNAKQYDGKTVVYAGEVIGEVMLRGKYAWINVNDGQNAIGIWMDKNLTKDILYTGSYKSRGDWIEIVGIFHRACLQHGGDLDLHAQAIKKINPGRNLQEKLNLGKRNLTFILLGIWVILFFLYRLPLTIYRKR